MTRSGSGRAGRRLPLANGPLRGAALMCFLGLQGCGAPIDPSKAGGADGGADGGGLDAEGSDGALDGAADGGLQPVVVVELGLGRVAFAPMAAEVGLVYGPQGGWHIEPAARVHGVAPDGLRLQWSAVDALSGEDLIYPVTSTLSARAVLPTEDGGWDRVGDLLIFDVDRDADVLGRTLRVGAALLDAEGGVLGAAEAELTVVCCG